MEMLGTWIAPGHPAGTLHDAEEASELQGEGSRQQDPTPTTNPVYTPGAMPPKETAVGRGPVTGCPAEIPLLSCPLGKESVLCGILEPSVNKQRAKVLLQCVISS